MKRNLIFLMLLATLALTAIATPVSPATARKAATNFMLSTGMKGPDIKLTDITEATPFSQMYIFDLNGNEGFIIIAGDDNSEPLLAFSLTNPFPTQAIPAHVQSWLAIYEKAIRHNSSTPQCKSASDAWQQLLNGNLPPASKDIIGPIIATQWNQSPYYNQLCPLDSAYNKRPPCGCTATATAQIMKHYNHPATGYGTGSYTHERYGLQQADYGATTYDWDNMPLKLNDNSSEAEVLAVAELIYHVGVAVHMDYAIGGSAGKTASYGYGGEPCSENAFKYNFRYSPYVWTAFGLDYDEDDWHDLMLNEVSNGRPVLYAGYDEVQSGHAFIIDGYNTASKAFHLNWGWGGSYDGYFKIAKLNPGPANNKYNFNLFATATIGIEPYDDFNTASTTTVTTAVQPVSGASAGDGSVTGAGTYNFGDTIILKAEALNEHTRFVQWSDGCRYNPRITVATGGEVSFTAQFAPIHVDVIGYYNSGNAMNRASNLPDGLGLDSVWGIKIPASTLWPHHDLVAVRYMGRKSATHTLSVLAGTDSPTEELYTATFFDSLDYDYTWHTHTLPAPMTINSDKNLWIVLKCSEIDTPAVFSIYGGNPNGMLSGEALTPMADSWQFSWMIDALFQGDGNAIEPSPNGATSITLYPNPATHQVTLSGLQGNTTVDLLDMSGRLCKSTHLTAGSSTLDVSNLRPALYLVRITTAGTPTLTKLLIR